MDESPVLEATAVPTVDPTVAPTEEAVSQPTEAPAQQASQTTEAIDSNGKDFEYEYLDDGTIEITGYTGKEKVLTIPTTIHGVPVTSLGEWAFAFDSHIKTLIVPEGVTNIAANVFSCGGDLEVLVLPSTLANIG